MQSLPSASLTAEGIQKTIHEVCEEVTKSQYSWIFRLADAKEDLNIPCRSSEFANLFGFVVTPATTNDDSCREPPEDAITSFSTAYSTWDGRVLYLDRFGLEQDETSETGKELMLMLPLVCCRIARRLECVRFVWQHYAALPNYRIQPQTLDGWLTLFWSSESIQQFLNNNGDQVAPTSAGDEGLDVNDAIRRVLDEPLGVDKFRVRLAETKDDASNIVRLVQGLADFEQESDAVHVAADHYLLDGFPAAQTTTCSASVTARRRMKLFHCLLLEDVSVGGRTASGMAFFFVGYNRGLGPYLYLEDLYIEPNCRKGGAGTTLMKTLGRIGLALGCNRLVWQALDWNSNALGFYCGKLGAKVQRGYITSRFAGPDLVEFSGSTDSK